MDRQEHPMAGGDEPELPTSVDPDRQRAGQPAEDRADRLQQRLAVPVLIAALASIPAIFLTLLDDPWSTIGTGVNSVSGGVLVLETVVLLTLTEDRRAWLRRNWLLVVVTIIIIPAVIFAIGPAQLLRLLPVMRVLGVVRFVGALRILRVKRILKAGRILRERYGMDRGWERAITVGISLLCAAFVAVVLADPTSTSGEYARRALDAVGLPGAIAAVIAGGIIAAATYVVARDRGDAASADQPGSPGSPPQSADRSG
jgi:CsoR family transcriptional regulator, copper-sensing transcriptional repressor